MDAAEFEYVGFWLRAWAAVIDSVLACIIIYPLLTAVYGPAYWSSLSMVQGPADLLLSWVAPAVAIVVFWIARQATPGKMAIGARIVDAQTGDKPSNWQFLGRYVGYYAALFPLFLGIFWVGFDARKQGWHDKLAGTVVIRKKGGVTQPVKFGG